MNTHGMFTKKNVEDLLALVGYYLKEQSQDVTIQLVGGSAWMLAHRMRDAVGDIDALWDHWDEMTLLPVVQRIAGKKQFDPKWLNNDAQSIFQLENPCWLDFKKVGGLRIQVPDDDTTAALLVAALKLVDPNDHDKHPPFGKYANDARVFAKMRGWDASTMLQHAQHAWGPKPFNPMCVEWLERLLPLAESSKNIPTVSPHVQ